MAVLVNRIVPLNPPDPEHCRPLSDELGSVAMLDILQRCRIGLRYSNEFYFVTPTGLLDISEIPVECGWIEVEVRRAGTQSFARLGPAVFSHFAPEHQAYCRVVVPAPWRETPGPTWQLAAAMLRNQKRAFQDRPPKPPAQQRLEFA